MKNDGNRIGTTHGGATEHKNSYFGEKITSFVNPGALAQAVP